MKGVLVLVTAISHPPFETLRFRQPPPPRSVSQNVSAAVVRRLRAALTGRVGNEFADGQLGSQCMRPTGRRHDTRHLERRDSRQIAIKIIAYTKAYAGWRSFLRLLQQAQRMTRCHRPSRHIGPCARPETLRSSLSPLRTKLRICETHRRTPHLPSDHSGLRAAAVAGFGSVSHEHGAVVRLANR